MIGKGVVSNRVATLAEVSEILEARKGTGEIGFEQQACLDYANKFKKLGRAKALKLLAEIAKNPKVKESTAAKIVDIMPRYNSQLIAILQKDRCDLNAAEMGAVLKEVAEAAKDIPKPKPEEKKEEEAKKEKEEKKEAKEEKKEEKESKKEKEEKEPSKKEAKEEKKEKESKAKEKE